MMSKKMLVELNKQINAEFFAAYLYFSMSAWFSEKNLDGFANWMYMQTKEEMTHGMRIYLHVLERGEEIELHAIDKPKLDWESPVEIFNAAYEHEKKVTGMINDLTKLAIEDNDYASQGLLRWFVDEQVEEEEQTLKILEQLKMIGDSRNGLFMMDNALAQRAFNAPTDIQV